MKYVVDTHALLWFVSGSARLGTGADAVLGDGASELVLPAIVLAEACWIIERGKVALPVGQLFKAIDEDPRFSVWPLDESIVRRSQTIVDVPEMHDRLIVATALVVQAQGETVALLTRDESITAANVVPIIW